MEKLINLVTLDEHKLSLNSTLDLKVLVFKKSTRNYCCLIGRDSSGRNVKWVGGDLTVDGDGARPNGTHVSYELISGWRARPDLSTGAGNSPDELKTTAAGSDGLRIVPEKSRAQLPGRML